MNLNIRKFGHGFPLVFFHGWGFDSKVWFSLLPILSKDYQLLLVDLPGFGHSPIMDWSLFKEKLLNQLPSSFALLGWSMGGLYAMRLAIEESRRVDFLISVASSPRFLLDGSWPGIFQKDFQQFYQRIVTNPHATLNEFLELNGLAQDEQVDYLPDKLLSVDGLKFGLNILETWDFREKLKLFTHPTYFMFGRLDPIVPVKTMHYMQKEYSKFNYILFNRAAHMPFLSHLDLFVKEIRDFIK